MWDRLFFQHTTLHDLGLQVQLGHAYSHPCPTQFPANATFRVIHSNGIHHVAIDQCWCHGVPLHKQILHIGWWLATPLNPRSAATFEVLQHFHLLNLQGKVTGFSFYQALEYQMDNTGSEPPPVCTFASINGVLNVDNKMSGSIGDLHVNGPGMASCQNSKACRPSFRSMRGCCNSPWFFGHPLSRVPPSKHQPSERLRKCATSTSVCITVSWLKWFC